MADLYIEVHTSLRENLKLSRLSKRLDVPEVHMVGHLVYLWLWALGCTGIEGEITKVSPEEMAIIMQYEGDATKLYEEMLACHWITKTDGKVFINDWNEYGGKVMARRDALAAYHRELRNKKKGIVPTDKPSVKPPVTTPVVADDRVLRIAKMWEEEMKRQATPNDLIEFGEWVKEYKDQPDSLFREVFSEMFSSDKYSVNYAVRVIDSKIKSNASKPKYREIEYKEL